VVDFGCWEGHFLPSLLGNYGHVVAIDNDRASSPDFIPGRWTILQAAFELCICEGSSTERLHLIKAEGRMLPLRSGSFDLVFCLDTLPFVREHDRASVVGELRRVLRTGGIGVFTLPVEIGPALLLRESLRRLSGTWQDGYGQQEVLRAVFRRPAAIADRSGAAGLIGYDYRQDECLIRSRFRVERRSFLPWNALRFISPTLLLSCRAV
jgi:SAM-dependent methyltransferase